VGFVDLQNGNGEEGLDFYRRVALLICGHGSYSITPHLYFFPGKIKRRGCAGAESTVQYK
jgi:hypothetical protein